jgi:hypothetical protein
MANAHLELETLREGICSYNNVESALGIRRGKSTGATCLCNEFPLSDEYDELEYRLAMERKGPVEIFGFLCEWGMMPRPLSERYGITKPSQLWEKVLPTLRSVDSITEFSLDSELDPSTRTRIGNVFSQLRNAIGPVSASKVLHVLKPDLFVPWDTKIRGYYNLDDGEEDYLSFLKTSGSQRSDLLSNAGNEDTLRKTFYRRGWKPFSKLLDELNWARVWELPPHFN